MKTKICFVMKYMQIGGVEKSLIKLCKELNPEKYDITVLLLSQGEGISNELPDYVKRIFVSRECTKSFKKQYSKFWCRIQKRATELAYNEKNNRLIRRVAYELVKIESNNFKKYVSCLFANEKFDNVIGFMQGESSDIAMHCIEGNRRIVFYHHGKVFEFLNDLAYYDKAQFVIVPSDGVKQELISKRGVPDSKIRILLNIYNIDNIIERSFEKCELDTDNHFKIVTVSRISSEKGISQAIEAAQTIKKSGKEFHWFFVGPYSDEDKYYIKCVNAIKENRLENNVYLIGGRTNPFPYYRIADIYVQSSEIEALPGTIVEALILKKAIVSTKNHGSLALLENEVNALLCNCSADSIAKSVMRLIDDAFLKNKIENGTVSSVEAFRNTINIYENLFAGE